MSGKFATSISDYDYGFIPKVPGLDNPNVGINVGGDGKVEGKTFGETVTSLLNKTNQTLGQPEALSIRAVETGDVDIHEVMVALGKSEVAFKLTTAITQKIIGAFDKLTSLQV